MAAKTTYNPDFDALAFEFVCAKEQEKDLVESRRKCGESLIALPEFQDSRPVKGSVTVRSTSYEVKVTFGLSESFELAEIAAKLSEEELDRVFPAKRSFSQSGLNQLLKELDAKSLTCKHSKSAAERVREVLEQHTKATPSAPQIVVARV